MIPSVTRDDLEASMPAKNRRTPTVPAIENTTPTEGDREPGRFAAGTGYLAEHMQENFERDRVQAQNIRLQKIDASGAPVGEPHHLGEGAVTLGLDPADQLADVQELADQLNTGATIDIEVTDPAAVEAIRELTRIPIPTAVINQWWPAFVRVPGSDHAWNLCKVFLTPQGLYVYRAAPTEPETFTSGALPTWYSSVLFDETRKPVSGYAARNAGIPIVTVAGTVNVQPAAGCGCAARGLKGWRPTWSRNVISWADGVALATNATEGR